MKLNFGLESIVPHQPGPWDQVFIKDPPSPVEEAGKVIFSIPLPPGGSRVKWHQPGSYYTIPKAGSLIAPVVMVLSHDIEPSWRKCSLQCRPNPSQHHLQTPSHRSGGLFITLHAACASGEIAESSSSSALYSIVLILRRIFISQFIKARG